jgi:hypothetical protein
MQTELIDRGRILHLVSATTSRDVRTIARVLDGRPTRPRVRLQICQALQALGVNLPESKQA